MGCAGYRGYGVHLGLVLVMVAGLWLGAAVIWPGAAAGADADEQPPASEADGGQDVGEEEPPPTNELDSHSFFTTVRLLGLAEEALAEGNAEGTAAHLEEAVAVLWAAAPLQVAHLTHVRSEPQFFGDIRPREDAVYRPGDALLLYLEPRHYSLLETEGGYGLHVVTGVRLLDEADAVIFDDPRFIDYEIHGRHPVREFFVRIKLNLGEGLPPGPYTVEITVTDEPSGDAAQASTGFEFLHD